MLGLFSCPLTREYGTLYGTPVHIQCFGHGQNALMRRVEYWLWRYRSPTSGRMVRSTWRMDEATVRAHPGEYPDAQKIDGTREVREVAETPEERMRVTPTGNLPPPGPGRG